jgi:hypothetical protein
MTFAIKFGAKAAFMLWVFVWVLFVENSYSIDCSRVVSDLAWSTHADRANSKVIDLGSYPSQGAKNTKMNEKIEKIDNSYRAFYRKKFEEQAVGLEKQIRFYEALKKQVEHPDYYYRALSAKKVMEILGEGVLQRFNYFAPQGGVRIGHNESFIFIRCHKSHCGNFMGDAEEPGSIINLESIPTQFLELVIPDFKAAAREVGITIP